MVMVTKKISVTSVQSILSGISDTVAAGDNCVFGIYVHIRLVFIISFQHVLSDTKYIFLEADEREEVANEGCS